MGLRMILVVSLSDIFRAIALAAFLLIVLIKLIKLWRDRS